MKSYFHSTLLGYVLIGAASNGFYQQLFFSENPLPRFFWPLVAIVGIAVLIMKSLSISNQRQSIIGDCFYVVPTILIPLAPIGHDWAMIVMLIYSSTFLIAFIFKNYRDRNT